MKLFHRTTAYQDNSERHGNVLLTQLFKKEHFIQYQRIQSAASLSVHSFMSASAFAPRSCPSQGGIRQILSKTTIKDPWQYTTQDSSKTGNFCFRFHWGKRPSSLHCNPICPCRMLSSLFLSQVLIPSKHFAP